MYLKQSKNILEEIYFGIDTRSYKKIVGIIYKKYAFTDGNVWYDFFDKSHYGFIEPKFI